MRAQAAIEIDTLVERQARVNKRGHRLRKKTAKRRYRASDASRILVHILFAGEFRVLALYQFLEFLCVELLAGGDDCQVEWCSSLLQLLAAVFEDNGLRPALK